MEGFRVRNLRALSDTGLVVLRPLTLLVGRNSSGKSTFLRALPLLRQSVEAYTRGPILWYGSLVDFGGFSEAVTSSAKDEPIGFGFKLVFRPNERIRYAYGRTTTTLRSTMHLTRPTEFTVDLSIGRDPKDNSVTRVQEIEIAAADQNIRVTFERGEVLESAVVNGEELSPDLIGTLAVSKGRILPGLARRAPKTATLEDELAHVGPLYRRSLAVGAIAKAMRPLFHGNTVDATIVRVARRLSFGSDEEILEQLQALPVRGSHFRTNVQRLRTTSTQFRRLRNLVLLNSLGELLVEIDRRLSSFASGVRYIKPVRATAERYYRPQDLAVDEMDPEGRNLAMFIRGLTEGEKKDFERWTRDELGWSVRAGLTGGHITLKIHREDGQAYNLTDVGFGFSQMLPVITQLWSMRRRPRGPGYHEYRPFTFAIEQPELHLHPALQATLADLLLRTVATARKEGVDLRLVIETHSEAIVNRIGRRIGQGAYDPDMAEVVLFEQGGGEGVTSTRRSTFSREGRLVDWPFGFFDADGDSP